MACSRVTFTLNVTTRNRFEDNYRDLASSMKHYVRYTAHKSTRLSLRDQFQFTNVTFYEVSTTGTILTAVFWVKVHGIVKMEVVTTSITSVPRYRTTRRQESEHETLLLQTLTAPR
jgi:hypothetical protein